jgi:hypothetical protein
MLIGKYDRRPFSVLAVQVDFENVDAVAEWCKGTVIKQKTKLMGVETDVPAIRVEGQGDNRGKSFVATLGCYIVELNGSFRVYKPASFHSTFEKAEVLVGETILDKALQDTQKDYSTSISLLDLKKNATPETKAEWSEDDNSSVDGQETAHTA